MILMKAENVYFYNFIKTDIHINIPLYQREYSWQKEQWKELWDDILEIGMDNTRNSYFVGSIVYKDKAGVIGTSSLPCLNIIDGQQRITTLTLLLCSILNSWDDIDDETEYYLKNFIFNTDYEKTRKLYLRNKDDITLEKVINYVFNDIEIKADENDSLNVLNAFKEFNKLLKDVDPRVIWEGINKLLIISVKLDSDDKAQSIFESLNSTGKELSNSDLIRNYILMDSNNQESLYKKYWGVIESQYRNLNEKEFDEFIRNYLMVKLGKNVTQRRVYKEFKHYKNLKYGEDIEALVKDIYTYFEYYSNLCYGSEPDKELKKVFDSLKELDYGVVYRFLLGVYADYNNSNVNDTSIKLSKEEFIQIVEYVESYVFRRYISGLDPNSMNNYFLTLRKNIDKDNYLNSFIANMLQYTEREKRRFPNDEEFNDSLKTKDVFHKTIIKNHFLYTLEKYNNKETVNFEGISVEHIMPQRLSKEWQDELGENFKETHDTYLHTIGNLTLTGYNPEMSNKPFTEKKTMKDGLNSSRIRLNEYFENIETWNEHEINKRREKLFEQIKEIWKYPPLTDEIQDLIKIKKEKERDVEYTLEDLFKIGEEEERTQANILYNMISPVILDIDEKISEKYNKDAIVYKINNKNFVKLEPQLHGIKLKLRINYKVLNDPRGICEDHSGRYSLPTVTFLKSEDDVYYVFNLIKQAYENVKSNGG